MIDRIFIVDDEALARLRIRRFLEQTYPDVVIGEAADGFEALERLPSFHPDLVFLDIEMPELSGFDVLHQLEQRPFHIIFQTAFDEFAVRAFDENACDYLLKPFSDDRIRRAIDRARGRLPEETQWHGLEAKLAQAKRFLERIVVPVGPQKSKLIEHTDVLCFQSEDHATRVVLGSTDYAYDYSLTFLEERLDPSRFLRVHRNAIVNLTAVTQVTHGPSTLLTLKNGLVVKVSRDRKANLDAILEAAR